MKPKLRAILVLLAATTVLFWVSVGAYYGWLFVESGFNRDFLAIDACTDRGGTWNYAARTCKP